MSGWKYEDFIKALDRPSAKYLDEAPIEFIKRYAKEYADLQLGEVRGLLKEMHDAYTFTDVRFTGTAMENAFIKVHKHLEGQPTEKPKDEPRPDTCENFRNDKGDVQSRFCSTFYESGSHVPTCQFAEKRKCEGKHEAGMKDGKWWCYKCDSPIKLDHSPEDDWEMTNLKDYP